MKVPFLAFIILAISSTLLAQNSRDKTGTRRQESPGYDQVPLKVQVWLDAELAKGKKTPLLNYASPEFFSRDTARLIGYIKGYKSKLGFSTGMVYASNEIVKKDHPVIITIHEDGRFEGLIPIEHPVYTFVTFQDELVRFYIEPGQTLAMIFDWNEFSKASRSQERTYQLKNIRFAGTAARINNELAAVKIKELDYKEFQQSAAIQPPNVFKDNMLSFIKESEAQLEQDLAKKYFTSQVKTILHHEIILSAASMLFDYIMLRNRESKKDSTNKALQIRVDASYYDFLQKIPLNDQSILISSQFSTFVNRLEFSEPLLYAAKNATGSKYIPFEKYLFTELGLKPSAEDLEFLNFQKTVNSRLNTGMSDADRKELFAQSGEKSRPFYTKYAKYQEQYNAKYPMKAYTPSAINLLNEWKLKDSILTNFYRLPPNMVYEIIKVRSLKFSFESLLKNQKDEARSFLTSLEKGISNPYFMHSAEEVFHRSFPATGKTAYQLPAEKGSEILREITDQFKGKMLFIDFWATTCAPCIFAIEQNKPIREKYKDSKDLEFIFLTSELESPKAAYTKFIKEQGLLRTYRLSNDDFQYLRQLFKFNGIPRYIVLNKEGQVLTDDFEMHNFARQIDMLLANK